MKRYVRCIPSFLTALALSIAGLFAPEGWMNDIRILGILIFLSVCPLLLLIFNLIWGRSYLKRLQRASIASMRQYMLRHREHAAQTAAAKLRQLKRIRRLTVAYAILLWLLAAAIAVFAGVAREVSTLLWTLLLLWSAVVFYAVYSRIHREKKQRLDEEDVICLTEQDYPQLYSAAHRAAGLVGCRDEIVILLTFDCNAGIVMEKGRCLLQLGIVLLHVMSQDELFCVLLHEFSHASEANRDAHYENRYLNWLSNAQSEHPWLLRFVGNLYSFFDFRYIFQHMVYEYATAVIQEQEADRAMAAYGSTEAAASALLKLYYDNMYLWESGVKDEEPLLKAESPTPDFLTNRIADFQKAIGERQGAWNALVWKEILANNASHPTLKMRLEALGVTELKTLQSGGSAAYDQEIRKALDTAEAVLCERRKTSYETDREENYLAPLKHIEAWTAAGKPISAEDYADVIADLRLLGRNEEAEAVCDRAIAELPEASSLYASYMKGCSLLHRFDEKGMEYVYRAIEKNSNFLDEGLDVVGAFCCYTGREAELSDYRERAARLGQKNMDETSHANYLTKHDRLEKEHLPDGMLENILDYIHSVSDDRIQNIYLLRKTISETFFTSVFLIRFSGGTDRQQKEILHKIFCYLDSYPEEWQFSLFEFSDYAWLRPDKIEGSLVWSKSGQTGKR